jgi:uncharacterized phage protein (TIGR02218 family)
VRVDIPDAVLEHLRGDVTSIAICWCIEKGNGEFIRGTEHDEKIVIDPTGESPESDLVGFYPAGANIRGSTVQAGTEMAPDNMSVDGAIPTTTDYIDVTVADIEAGLLNQAPVTVFFVNWQAPNDGFVIMKRGYLGEIARDSDGKYSTEVRGLAQLLAQVFVETFGVTCSVKRFGDERCKLDVTPYTFTGTVTAVTNRKAFTTDLSLSPYPDFRGAEFRFDTGANADYTREAKSGAFTFWDAFPNDVEPGDSFTVIQACPRTIEACKQFGNIVNFRGYGVFIPGIDALAKGPT